MMIDITTTGAGTPDRAVTILADGVYKVKMNPSGKTSEFFYTPDKSPGEFIIHRSDGPAVTIHNCAGDVIYEKWYHNNKIHRVGGPAVIYYGEQGNVLHEEWYQNGLAHRTDGPAVIYYGEQLVLKEEWHQNGEFHRDNGPAHIIYNTQGDIVHEGWL